MPRDEPEIKKIPCTRLIVKTFDRFCNTTVDRLVYLHGTYATKEQELEEARKQLEGQACVVLDIIKEERGYATVSMPLETYLRLAKLHHSTITTIFKEKQK